MDERLLKAQAREALAGKWWTAILVAAVATIVGSLGHTIFPDDDIYRVFNKASREIYLTDTLRFSFKNGIFGIAAFIMGGVLDLGYSQFANKMLNKQDASFQDLTSQFHRFGDGFVQMLLRNIYTALWTCLLIIPGIIASYSYAMTPYIMLDQPELSPSQAIAESKEMMKGHKGELFTLHLSMLGWSILSVLTLNLGFLALNPYLKLSEAAFYRQLTTCKNAQ